MSGPAGLARGHGSFCNGKVAFIVVDPSVMGKWLSSLLIIGEALPTQPARGSSNEKTRRDGWIA